MANLSNWETMVMLIVILLVVFLIGFVLCRQQNMYQAWCINMCNRCFLREATPSSRRNTTASTALQRGASRLERAGSKGSKMDYEAGVDTATPIINRKIAIPVIVSTSPSMEKMQHDEKTANNDSQTEYGSQALLEPPDQMKRASSCISLSAIDGEYDSNATDGITHLKRTYSALSFDPNSTLVPLLPEPMPTGVSAMVEASLCFDAARGYLNVGIAYAYTVSLDLKSFSECYIRLIVTATMPPPASPPRPQYRTTKVVKTAEIMEVLQKFRFDITKIDSVSKSGCYELAKVQLELNAYGRARSHTTVAKREMVLDSNMMPNCEPRIAMIHLYQPNFREIWEPPAIGEFLVSLCYQPATSKLTLILLQIKNLRLSSSSSSSSSEQAAVKIAAASSDNNADDRSGGGSSRRESSRRRHHRRHRDELRAVGGSASLIVNGKAVSRKRLKEITNYEEQTDRLEFNEVAFFQLDKDAVQMAELRVIIERVTEDGRRQLAGFFFIGNSASGNGLLHWKYVTGNTRKPYVLWHPITKYPVEKEPPPTSISHRMSEQAHVEVVSEVTTTDTTSSSQAGADPFSQVAVPTPPVIRQYNQTTTANTNRQESITKTNVPAKNLSQIKPLKI